MRTSGTFTGSCNSHRYFGTVAVHKSVNLRDQSLRESLKYHLKNSRNDYQALAAMCDTVLRCAQSDSLKTQAQFLLHNIEALAA